MRTVCVGGGPGGLMLAILLRLGDPSHEVTVYERNAVEDTFGFGVVFSAETLENVEEADPVVFARIAARFRRWSAIDIRFRGRTLRSDGHTFAAIARKQLLRILADRAVELGVDLRTRTEAPPLAELRAGHDLVVACDGVHSGIRTALADELGTTLEQRRSVYIWFATDRPYQNFTFLFSGGTGDTAPGRDGRTPAPAGDGADMFQAHVYPYDATHSTFIVEADQDSWVRAGLRLPAQDAGRPGETDTAALRYCEERFGHRLIGNNSRPLQFTVVRNQVWHHGNVVLLGDAAHTAHFSIGSGTKLAMEDAIALAGALGPAPDVETALKEYESERQPAVASLQRAAQTSLEWFEGVRRYRRLDHEPFAFQLLTRSQRITYDNLRMRDPEFVRGVRDHFHARWRRAHPGLPEVPPDTPPMFYPLRLRGLVLPNRVGVSPMAQYSAVDGVPNDWHLVHLGSRAVGGAGLVMTEMTCVSPEGRITPGCTGLWNDEQAEAWERVVRFVHGSTRAAIGIQLGHAGRKGATKPMWEGNDEPLDTGAWPLISASPLPYRPDSQVPREMDRADLETVLAQHVRSTEYAERAGFDLLELHFAHGYLLSGFLSPLTNRRTDGLGGPLRNRARYPLEVVRAVRAAWPSEKPLSVRISAHDWVSGGFTGDDAVEFAGMLAGEGVDIVDVSTGQTTVDARPSYGRLYQTPFADRIRTEVGIPTMTVGAVSSVDDVNTIVLAGRADLCLIARPHLVDPYWTLNAAIDQGYTGHPWPNQYLSGRTARRREQQP